MQLRATLAELGMPGIPSIHPMLKVQDQFDDDGTPRYPAHVRRVGPFPRYIRMVRESALAGAR